MIAASATADDDPLASARQLFVLAYAAAEAGAPLPLAAEPAALRDYALYPYLERARLTSALRGAAQGGRALTTTFARSSMRMRASPSRQICAARGCRASARASNGRRSLERSIASIADPALRCQNVTRANRACDAVARRPPPPSCGSYRSACRPSASPCSSGCARRKRLPTISSSGAFVRCSNNDQAGFARTVAGRLPERRVRRRSCSGPISSSARQPSIDIALSDPARARRTEDAMLLAGWTKLARNDPAAAHARFERLAAAVGPERTERYALALAFGLAWDRRAAEALEAFAVVPAANLDDYALSWAARAALWTGDWPQVERTIAAMSDAQRDQPRWRYWAARAAAQRHDEQRAETLYASVLPNRQLLRGERRRAAEAPRGAAPANGWPPTTRRSRRSPSAPRSCELANYRCAACAGPQ